MMSRVMNSINMLYIILILVLCLGQGESHPNINQMHEGKYGYNPYRGIDPRNLEIGDGREQLALAPSPERSFSTYVPLIDGSPIYIPDMQTDFRFKEGHQSFPKSSRRRTDETFSNRRSSSRRHHRPKTHHAEVTEFPMRPFGNRRRKHGFLERPDVDFETSMMESFTKDRLDSEDPESFTKKEKPTTHKKPPIHVKPEIVVPEVVYNPGVIIEEEYDSPIVVEALTKKEKPVTHKKPSIHVKPEIDITEDEYPDIVIEGEYDHPVVVETLTKKEKPHTPKKPIIHIKPEEPEDIVDPVYKEYRSEIIEDEYDDPVVVEALTKKEKPVIHKKPSIHVKPEEIVIPDYKGYHPEIIIEDAYEYPVVVEALTKKEKPVTHVKPPKHKPEKPETVPEYKEFPKFIAEDEKDNLVGVEALTKKEKPVTHVKPPKHKPEKPDIVVPEYKEFPKFIAEDEKDNLVGVDTLTKKEKPVTHKKPNIHTKPEEIVDPEYNEYPEYIDEEYDHPVVIEALTKKEKPIAHKKPIIHVKPEEPEDIVDPEYNKYPEYVVEEEYDHPVVVEALTKKEKPGTHKKPSIHIKPEKPGEMDYPGHVLDKREFNHENEENEMHPETSRSKVTDDGSDLAKRFFDINSLEGSGSIPENLISRSFIPVDPNIWSLMSDIHAQERQKFKSCLTPKQEIGNCMPIQLCSLSNVASSIEDLLNNVCTIDEVFIGICCPEFPVETVRVDWDKFEEKQIGDNVSDSETAKECGKLPTSVNQTVSWPWTAPLVAVSTGKEFCGGALVSEQYVLSAAHCTTKIPSNRILIRLGPLNRDGKSEDFEVIEIKRHAQYNSRTLQNDIALLKLSRKVKLGDFRRLICLPDDLEYAGETSILLGPSGFSEKTDELESLLVISNRECQNKMGVVVGNDFLCTMPRKEDTKCNDDSGAPLVVGQDDQFKIVGVLTWSRNDCDGRFPSKFTRVSKYKKWIENHAV